MGVIFRAKSQTCFTLRLFRFCYKLHEGAQAEIIPCLISQNVSFFARVSERKRNNGIRRSLEGSGEPEVGGEQRGVVDFILREVAFVCTLGSAIAMGTNLPFFTQFIRFRAKCDDLPTFTFFVVANSVVSAYLILSLSLSIFHIVKSGPQNSRIVLVMLNTLVLTLMTAGASASAAIVYLAHKGNTRTNWFSICQQFNSFCERISGSLIGSFGAVVLVLLIFLSTIALSRR